MWTDTTRAQYARADLALPSDLTDAGWALLEPFFPVSCRVGRPRKWPLRRVVEAILYLLRAGLTACIQLTPEEQREAEVHERIAQEQHEWAEVQQIWRLKEQEGQGCEGEVLRDPRLSEVVVGKHHIVMWVEDHVPDPKEGAVESRLYDNDGVLYSPLISDFYEAKFTIKGSLLCHSVLLPEGEYESCFRLMESPDGAIFEERLIPPGRSPDEANATNLSCL